MIRVQDLRKSFGAVKAVQGVSFEARDGRITGLLGPNGAGKSTTLRVLYTVLKPDSGNATIDGIDVQSQSLEAWRRIGQQTPRPTAILSISAHWYGPGTVYSFRLEADGIWREADRLIASDSARMDDFGRAIATLENIAAVAAPRKHDGAGVVYLFGREAAGANWQERSILTAPDGGQFGSALALDERQLLIAAPGAAGGGVVYSYNRSNTSAPAQVIEAPATAGPGGFGMAMALDGETLLIAAPAANSYYGQIGYTHNDRCWVLDAGVTVGN